VSWGAYLLRRLILAAVVLAAVSVVTFFVARVVPSDPAALYVGPRPRQEQVEDARRKLGLDRPLPQQYVAYVGDLLRGDLGISLRSKQPISVDLRAFLPATLELVTTATLVSLIIGIPLGVYAGARPNGALDHVTRIASIGGVSIPTFWLALILQLVFFRTLHWLPLGGRLSNEVALNNPVNVVTGFYAIDAAVTGNWVAWRDALWHLVLPAVCLAAYPVGLVTRMTRSSMVDVLGERYITAARAEGIPERIIRFRLALKNAILPTLTVLGLTFAYSVTGAFLVEIVFAWPGVGTYVTQSILSVDFPVIIGVTLVVTVVYLLVNLGVDLIHAAIDPRAGLS
jgi:peptide/nickel transport system permease protein